MNNNRYKRFSGLLLTWYVIALVVIPHAVEAIAIYGSGDWVSTFRLLCFLPMTLYNIPPFLVSGGYGFVGQIGVGPDSPIGFVIAACFWFCIAFLIMSIRLRYRRCRGEGEQHLGQIVRPIE